MFDGPDLLAEIKHFFLPDYFIIEWSVQSKNRNRFRKILYEHMQLILYYLDDFGAITDEYPYSISDIDHGIHFNNIKYKD